MSKILEIDVSAVRGNDLRANFGLVHVGGRFRKRQQAVGLGEDTA